MRASADLLDHSRAQASAGSGWPDVWFDLDPHPRIILTPAMQVLRGNAAAAAFALRNAGWTPVEGALRPPEPWPRMLAEAASVATPTPKALVVGPIVASLQRLSRGAEVVIALTLRDLASPSGAARVDLEAIFGVTPAEQQIVVLMMQGHSAHEIAERLRNSVLTIRTHMKRLHIKLGVKTKEQLFARLGPYLFAL